MKSPVSLANADKVASQLGLTTKRGDVNNEAQFVRSPVMMPSSHSVTSIMVHVKFSARPTGGREVPPMVGGAGSQFAPEVQLVDTLEFRIVTKTKRWLGVNFQCAPHRERTEVDLSLLFGLFVPAGLPA
jgi:hypothetical protein